MQMAYNQVKKTLTEIFFTLSHQCSLIITLLVISSLLQSCASPTQLLLKSGSDLGFTHRTFAAKSFKLEAFIKEKPQAGGVLHVYLEGDGLPWSSKSVISADPTPRNPLMLRLMAMDPSPSLYLGRPCYNGHAHDVGCSPLLWTHRRFSPEVLSAMEEALAAFYFERCYSGLVLIGHSGGGTIALLLARHFPTIHAVVTLAGNPDIDVWADLHGYSRLQGSLNPANFKGGEYPEFHYLGEKDELIPPPVFQPVLRKRHNAQIIMISGFDHVCCWDSLWPDILRNL